MESIKFDPKKLDRLNNPERMISMPPDLIWDCLQLTKPGILIDIGAGTGFFAKPFAKKASRLYACDISDVMLNWMKNNLESQVLELVIPTKMEESSVPLDAEVADLVYMINLHHELKEPHKIIQESSRLLKAGGKIMIIDFKPIGTKKGPPLSIRVPVEKVMDQVANGGFTNVCQHNIMQDHFMVTGVKSNEAKG